jgi:fumarylpyruvate hydrolase
MTNLIFGARALPSLPIFDSAQRYEVRRVFCVGRNYAEHAAEMGNTVDRTAPFYFTKSPFAIVSDGENFPYPPKTIDCHYEMEFVIAMGDDGIFGYAGGLDMTRRDLQWASKEKKRPWDTSKDFEYSAIIGAITPTDKCPTITNQRICLRVNDAIKQEATLDQMIHSTQDIIKDLATYYTLGAGDIIMTGTPAGVGSVQKGDTLHGHIDGLCDVITIVT